MLGASMTIHVGPAVPTPLSRELVPLVEQVTVTHQDTGRSGFQVTLVLGRDAASGRHDYPALADRTFRIGNRLQVTARLGVTTHVLSDGIITNVSLAPSTEPNGSRLTVTGEDLAVLLDQLEVSLPFPGMADWHVAGAILGGFAALGVLPVIVPEPSPLLPLPTDTTNDKSGTFLGILDQMAERWGYVFYVDPGPTRGLSTAYWGPPIRAGVPQRALTLGMAPYGNLTSISFTDDGTKPALVYGLVQEEHSNVPVPITGLPFTGQPMAALPSYVGNQPLVSVKRLEDSERGNVVAALWRATGEVYRANKAAVTASGELDVARYGTVLRARGLVDVRGVGRTHDGTWYVQSTTHTVGRGSWTQSFTLEREGTGALADSVASV